LFCEDGKTLRESRVRIAVLSDIHGNGSALEAAIADLRVMAPDAVLFGGDLADGGSTPVEVVDCVRERGWPAVLGNTDEMLIRPDSLERFASVSNAPQLWQKVRAIAAATREVLGEDRLAWIAQLPAMVKLPGIAVVHAQLGTAGALRLRRQAMRSSGRSMSRWRNRSSPLAIRICHRSESWLARSGWLIREV
jgi:hypothetical protein